MNADLPRSDKRRLVERGPAFRNEKLASVGVVTGVPDELRGDLDGAEFLTLRHEVRDATRAFTAEVLERIPDAPDVESTVRLRFEALRFLNPSAGTSQVWLLGSVRAGDLASSGATARGAATSRCSTER